VHLTPAGEDTLYGVDLRAIADELDRSVSACRLQWMSNRWVRGVFSDDENDFLIARYKGLDASERRKKGFHVEMGIELNRSEQSVCNRLFAINHPEVKRANKRKRGN
jgi:hypothetical protein